MKEYKDIFPQERSYNKMFNSYLTGYL